MRSGDGWKLSMRIRFIHARIRHLLNNSEDWDHGAWGAPVSAAHLGFAISVFSMRLLEYSMAVGARYNKEEQESVLAIWRYSGYIMGIPETILYTTGAEAQKIYEIGYMCEPRADDDCGFIVGLSGVCFLGIRTQLVTRPSGRDHARLRAPGRFPASADTADGSRPEGIMMRARLTRAK